MTQFNNDPNFRFNRESLFNTPSIIDEQELKERKIDDALAWLSANDPNSNVKTFGMLDNSSEIKYLQERNHQLEQDRDWKIEQRLFQHQREVSEIEQTTVLENFVGPAHQGEIELKKLIQEKITKQEKIRDNDVQLIKGRYQTLIKQCQEKLDFAQTNYEDAYRRWQDEHYGTNVQSAS
jgi:hypothetical protein